MIDSTISLYKLMVLFLLEKAGFSLANTMITDCIVGKGYTTYFKLQEVLKELSSAGLIAERNEVHTTWYELTDEGRETLSYFDNEISPDIRRDLTAFLKKNGFALRSESGVTARYRWTSDRGYLVTLGASEGEEELIRIELPVDSEETAMHICENWKKKNAALYADLIHALGE